MKRTNSRLLTRKDAIALLLVILAVILILENRSTTTIRFFIPEVSAPLWTVLLVCLLLGGGLGVALVIRRSGLPRA